MAWWVITPEITDKKGRRTPQGHYGPFPDEFQAQQKQDKLDVDSERYHTLSRNWTKAREELVDLRSEEVGHIVAAGRYRNLDRGPSAEGSSNIKKVERSGGSKGERALERQRDYKALLKTGKAAHIVHEESRKD